MAEYDGRSVYSLLGSKSEKRDKCGHFPISVILGHPDNSSYIAFSENILLSFSFPPPPTMSTHSHVDLVRALESIDQSVLHNDTLSSHEHTHHDHHDHITTIGHHHEASGRQEDLSEWTREELQAEIVKLRQMAGIANDSNMTAETLPTSAEGSADPSLREKSLATLSAEGNNSKGKRKRKSPSNDVTMRKVQRRHSETGKRLEKKRRTELAKVIRNKVSFD